MEKKNIGMKVAIIILTILVVGLTGYVVYDKVFSNKHINITDDNNNCDDESNDNLKINVDKLHEIGGMADFYFIKREYTDEYSFNLSTDGKVYINFDNYISNISNAKDIFLQSKSHMSISLFILTEDGNLYEYDVNNTSNKYTATKIDKYSNIVKIISYQTGKSNAGGCNFLIAIDNKGNYYEVASLCV